MLMVQVITITITTYFSYRDIGISYNNFPDTVF